MKAVCIVLVALVGAILADRSLLGNRQNHPNDWTKMGRADADAEVSFTIALKQRNLDVLDKTFWAVSTPGNPRYREFLTKAQIEDIIRPAKADVARVLAWLKENEATKVEFPLVDSVEVTVTVAQAEKMFETEFFTFQNTESKKEMIKQWGSYSIPSELKSSIDLVLGLADFPMKFSGVKRNNNINPDAIPVVVPQTIFSMYGAPGKAINTQNISQGVIEFEGQYFSPAEYQTFASEMGLTLPAITADHIVGTNFGSSPQIEATLDIQYISATGLGVTDWFWIEKNGVWQYGFSTHIFQQDPAPYVVSISYGWNEAQQCESGIGGEECQQLGVDSRQYVTRTNTEFQKVGLRGITVVVSSGDSGVNGRTDEGCTENHFNPDYPTSCPYILSVGATQVANPEFNLPSPPQACSGSYSCISSGEEHCVSFSQAHFASGGGFSNFAAQPSYQKDAVSGYLNADPELPPASYYNASGRGYPDVAAFGSNVLIYSGGLEPVGGTSASAPIFAGIIGLLNDAAMKKDGKPLGFINPLIYQMAKDSPDTFTDITVGDNICTESGCSPSCKGFKAYKGWDPVSGLGTPNYPNMLAYIQQNL